MNDFANADNDMPLVLRSPEHDDASVPVPAEAALLGRPLNGVICSSKGDEYPVKDNIIDLLKDGYPAKSLAEHSGNWGVTASVYEDLWRKNAVSLLSGEKFPWEQERRLIEQCLRPRPREWYLDIGCSTALYARLLFERAPQTRIVAMDYSLPMLKRAREKCRKENCNVFLLRADAHEMPFFRASFDGALFGGTLNELRDPLKVLFEIRRILKENARLFIMYVLKADSWYLRLAQSAIQTGGLTFWSLNESKELFRRCGFKVGDIEQHGLVCFACLTAV